MKESAEYLHFEGDVAEKAEAVPDEIPRLC